jgi:hypothetical protein
MKHIGQGQSTQSSTKTLKEVSTGQTKWGLKTGAFILIHTLFYLLERVPSKFIKVDTKLVTAAKYFLSFAFAW